MTEELCPTGTKMFPSFKDVVDLRVLIKIVRVYVLVIFTLFRQATKLNALIPT